MCYTDPRDKQAIVPIQILLLLKSTTQALEISIWVSKRSSNSPRNRRMGSNLFLEYQRTLIRLCLDEGAAISILSSYCGGQFGDRSAMWECAVSDFVERNLSANLIQVGLLPNSISSSFNPEELPSMLRAQPLSAGSEEGIILWSVLQFTGTERLRELLSKEKLCDWVHFQDPLKESFVAELIRTYESAGFPLLDLQLK
jgi:hypothetical protein